MTAGFAPVPGGQLYYEQAGIGPAVVFIHAGIADGRMWDTQMELADSFTIVRFDGRGFGRSPVGESPFAAHDDVLALMDHLGIAQAALVGCSMGGSIALDVALSAPERVRALVLVGAHPRGLEVDAEVPPQWEQAVAAFKAGDYAAGAEYDAQMWVDGLRRSAGTVAATIRDAVREMDEVALRNEDAREALQTRPEWAQYARLSELDMPVLVVVGDLDMADIVTAADALAEHIPGAQLVTMHDTAHLPNMERPEEFNAHLRAALS